MVEGRVVVERVEVLLRHVDAFEHTLANGDARHHDDEFLESVSLVQLEDGAKIDVSLARAGLHLDRELTPLKGGDLLDFVGLLHGLDVPEDVLIANVEPVSQPKLGLEKPAYLNGLERNRPGLRIGLAFYRPDDSVDGFLLVLKRGIELEFHAPALKPS